MQLNLDPNYVKKGVVPDFHDCIGTTKNSKKGNAYDPSRFSRVPRLMTGIRPNPTKMQMRICLSLFSFLMMEATSTNDETSFLYDDINDEIKAWRKATKCIVADMNDLDTILVLDESQDAKRNVEKYLNEHKFVRSTKPGTDRLFDLFNIVLYEEEEKEEGKFEKGDGESQNMVLCRLRFRSEHEIQQGLSAATLYQEDANKLLGECLMQSIHMFRGVPEIFSEMFDLFVGKPLQTKSIAPSFEVYLIRCARAILYSKHFDSEKRQNMKMDDWVNKVLCLLIPEENNKVLHCQGERIEDLSILLNKDNVAHAVAVDYAQKNIKKSLLEFAVHPSTRTLAGALSYKNARNHVNTIFKAKDGADSRWVYALKRAIGKDKMKLIEEKYQQHLKLLNNKAVQALTDCNEVWCTIEFGGPRLRNYDVHVIVHDNLLQTTDPVYMFDSKNTNINRIGTNLTLKRTCGVFPLQYSGIGHQIHKRTISAWIGILDGFGIVLQAFKWIINITQTGYREQPLGWSSICEAGTKMNLMYDVINQIVSSHNAQVDNGELHLADVIRDHLYKTKLPEQQGASLTVPYRSKLCNMIEMLDDDTLEEGWNIIQKLCKRPMKLQAPGDPLIELIESGDLKNLKSILSVLATWDTDFQQTLELDGEADVFSKECTVLKETDGYYQAKSTGYLLVVCKRVDRSLIQHANICRKNADLFLKTDMERANKSILAFLAIPLARVIWFLRKIKSWLMVPFGTGIRILYLPLSLVSGSLWATSRSVGYTLLDILLYNDRCMTSVLPLVGIVAYHTLWLPLIGMYHAVRAVVMWLGTWFRLSFWKTCLHVITRPLSCALRHVFLKFTKGRWPRSTNDAMMHVEATTRSIPQTSYLHKMSRLMLRFDDDVLTRIVASVLTTKMPEYLGRKQKMFEEALQKDLKNILQEQRMKYPSVHIHDPSPPHLDISIPEEENIGGYFLSSVVDGVDFMNSENVVHDYFSQRKCLESAIIHSDEGEPQSLVNYIEVNYKKLVDQLLSGHQKNHDQMQSIIDLKTEEVPGPLAMINPFFGNSNPAIEYVVDKSVLQTAYNRFNFAKSKALEFMSRRGL